MRILLSPTYAGSSAVTIILVFIALLGGAFLGMIIYKLYCRFIRDSARRQRTVRARFIRHELVAGKIEMADKMRSYGNTSVFVEKHLLFFQEAANGKELSFEVEADKMGRWRENQEGFLTYSGHKLIHFQAG